VAQTLDSYAGMDKDEWRLIKVDGDMVELKCNDIPRIVDGLFFLALRYWKRYKRFGVADWRLLTIAQVGVIELFDNLFDKGSK